MDIYTNPAVNTYILGQPFYMPFNGTSKWGISYTNEFAGLIMACYTLLITLVFLVGWNIIVCLVIAIYKTGNDPNRYVGLVAFLNSHEPWTAIFMMLSYCKIALTARSMRTFVGGVILCLLSVGMVAGSFVAGIMIPGHLSMGSVAPAQPEALFYPKIASISERGLSAEKLRLNAVRAPAALRAIGSIEASKVTLRKMVRILRDVATENGGPGAGPLDRGSGLSYNYTLWGHDFGLQRAPALSLVVQGKCSTDYSWRIMNLSDTSKDVYHPWGLLSEAITVDNNGFAPMFAEFKTHPEDLNQLPSAEPDFPVRYAVVIHAAGRRSYTAGADPFFLTGARNVSRDVHAPYLIKQGRPALSCTEKSHWNLNGERVVAFRLMELPSINKYVPEFLRETVIPNELGIPRIVYLAERLGGQSVFVSTSQQTGKKDDGLVDAEKDNIADDMERLILAAYASSRNILIDMTMVTERRTLENDVIGPQGDVIQGTADFVLATGDVTTLSMTLLIAIPVILGGLTMIQGGLNCYMRVSHVKKHPDQEGKVIIDSYVSRARLLQATQLYRFLNSKSRERLAHPTISWSPEIGEEYGLHMPFSRQKQVDWLLPVTRTRAQLRNTTPSDGEPMPVAHLSAGLADEKTPDKNKQPSVNVKELSGNKGGRTNENTSEDRNKPSTEVTERSVHGGEQTNNKAPEEEKKTSLNAKGLENEGVQTNENTPEDRSKPSTEVTEQSVSKDEETDKKTLEEINKTPIDVKEGLENEGEQITQAQNIS